MAAHCDLLIIGGGINGAGIARDAAGRGLKVVLAEKGDLGAATSWASSKLIHGGLRYLEHFEFRLVAEALAEREVLLRVAAHLVRPLRFVVPHAPGLRPRWMIRLGLFLYDHLARRSLLPGSEPVRLDRSAYGEGLRHGLKHGFLYSDCRVDDARLVLANALDAHARGARIQTRTEVLRARRSGAVWLVQLANGEEIAARALVNAAGPWVKRVLDERLGGHAPADLRLVQGSHIVVPKRYPGEHAFILQNDDARVVFLIPFEERFTLVGTTEVPLQGEPGDAHASAEEVQYLCRAASRYLAQAIAPSDVVWRFAGVRPLADDGRREASAVSRDYNLHIDEAQGAPALSVFGGKITTYRSLAEHAMEKLRPYFPDLKAPWTADVPLPGSDFASREEARRELFGRYGALPAAVVQGVFRRHGALSREVLGDGLVGEHYGAGLTERELAYFMEREWACSADDVLWRRSKLGLHLDERQKARVAERIGR
jgi:glycerol-3-phosphate dehydrogenase